MLMGVLPSCVSVNHEYARYPQEPEEGVRFFEIEITDSCRPPNGFWELNQCPLEQQSGILITQPSLQPVTFCIT